MRATIRVGEFPRAVTVGAGAVWVIAGRRLVRINPKTNRVVARSDPGIAVGSERTSDIAVGAGAVWVVASASDRRSFLVRLDPHTSLRWIHSTEAGMDDVAFRRPLELARVSAGFLRASSCCSTVELGRPLCGYSWWLLSS